MIRFTSAESMRRKLEARRRDIYEGRDLMRRRVDDDAVALTFDDGPHPDWTPRFLDVLRDTGTLATFFCVGANAERYPALVRRIVDDGHALGSHSFTHAVHDTLRPAAAMRDYLRGRDLVSAAAGVSVRLFRPPHGRLNPVNALLCKRAGMQTWLWTADAEDWEPHSTADALTDRYISRTRGGDVVLMHDWIEQPTDAHALDRSALLAAVPRVVSHVQSRGLRLALLG